MNDAITIFYYMFNKIYDFVFNKAFIAEDVSVGWIFVTVVMFGLLIRSILNVPTGIISRKQAADRAATRSARKGS